MAKAIALWEGGIHARVEYAVREDGVVFKRFQSRHPLYGYRWSAWSATGETLGENARANPESTRSSGFSTLTLNAERAGHVRLPN